MELNFVKGEKISVKDSDNTLNPHTLNLYTEAGYVYLITIRNKKLDDVFTVFLMRDSSVAHFQ